MEYMIKVTSLNKIKILLKKTSKNFINQKGGFFGHFLGPLTKASLALMKTILRPLPKSVLIPLGLTTVSLATDAAI